MTSDFMARLNTLAQISQQKLVKILDSIPGKKDFVIEPSVMKPLERFIGVSVLRSHGIDKIYKLDKAGLQTANGTVVFIIRSDLITAKRICDQISAHAMTRSDTKYHVILVPKMLVSIELLFEEEGLFGKVTFHVFSWELIQLDSKVLSFECPEIFKQLFVNCDQSLLTAVAKSLWSLQHVFGKPQLAWYCGQYSNVVSSMVDLWDEEVGKPDRLDSDIGCLLVVDRCVDYVSPLLMPGTYTSLVADVIGVATGVVEVKKPDPETKGSAVTMLLTSEDEVYNQIKNRHFSDVFIYLKNKVNDSSVEMAKRSTMGIQEMREFVKHDLEKAATMGKALGNHINVCETVTNEIGHMFISVQESQENVLESTGRRDVLAHIEDIMATAKDMTLALRLIALLSHVQNGFSHDESNSLRMQFLHAYGHQHLATFHSLEKLGLFFSHPSIIPTSITETGKLASKMAQVVSLPKKTPFQVSAYKLKLLREANKEYNLKDPQDLGYVFGGAYIPLVAQVVSHLIKKEMTLGELAKCLPGRTESRWVGKTPDTVLDLAPRAILVYILGGITYAEVAALQLLEKRTGCRIICAGSQIITGNGLLQSAT